MVEAGYLIFVGVGTSLFPVCSPRVLVSRIWYVAFMFSYLLFLVSDCSSTERTLRVPYHVRLS